MRWAIAGLVFLAAAVIGHMAVLWAAPSVIMGGAMRAMERRGVPQDAFALAPRMTPETQSVVRPAPELAYSICRFDMSREPRGVRVRMAAWPGYSSLAFYDGATNSFARLRGDGQAREIVLLPPGSRDRDGALHAPTEKGLILIRRLAPRPADHARVQRIARGDVCRPL